MNARRSDCPDDLVAQSSREDLSELARRALGAHAANCVDCRAALALAAALHQVPDALPSDADIVSRVAASAGLIGAGRESRATRRTIGVAAAVAILCTVTAAAALVTWSRRDRRPVPPTIPASSMAEPHANAARVAAPVTEPPAPSAEGGEADRDEAKRNAPPSPRRRSSPPTPQPSALTPRLQAEPDPAVTPATLFSEANALRARGDLPGAANRYATLRRRFPDSREAILSAISLGKLLLAQGDGTGALVSFDAYLAQRSPGPLVEEALVGRARALRVLGRADDERATWDALLKRFRGSAYEALARQRLSELAP